MEMGSQFPLPVEVEGQQPEGKPIPGHQQPRMAVVVNDGEP